MSLEKIGHRKETIMNRYRFYEIIQAAERGEDLSKFIPANAPEAALLADLLTVSDDGGGESVKIAKPVYETIMKPVPNVGFVDKITFNTKLSSEEVDNIIFNANLNYSQLDFSTIYSIVADMNKTYSLIILDFASMLNVQSGHYYMIAKLLNGVLEADGFVYISSMLAEAMGDEVPFSGWNPSLIDGEFEIKTMVINEVDDIAVGEQNESLINLVCVGSAIDTGEVEVVRELSGDYKTKSINVSISGTHDKIKYNVLDLINEKDEIVVDVVGTTLVSDTITLVEKVYFNTTLNVDEVNTICNEITYIDIPAILPAPFYIAFANADLSRCIAIVKDAYGYYIAEGNFTTMQTIPLFDGEGWVITKKEYLIGSTGINFIDMLQIPVGDQNDKLSKLISMNAGFTVETETVRTFPEEIVFDTTVLKKEVTDIAEQDVLGKILSHKKIGTVVFPASQNRIYDRSFYEWRMEGLVLHNKISTIGYAAFEQCMGIDNVYFTGTIEEWCNFKFSDAKASPMKDTHFHLLNEDGGYYEVTEIEIPSSITTINHYQFYGFRYVKRISIPNGVKNIYSYAFSNCESIESIVIPNSVTTINGGAFSSCTSLKNITIPDGITIINNRTFAFCDSLKSIVIPNSVTRIEREAFYACHSLTDVYFKGTEEQWNAIAFDEYNNEALTNATIHFNYEG